MAVMDKDYVLKTVKEQTSGSSASGSPTCWAS